MIDVVGFFEKQIHKWNEEARCGECWHFEYVQRLSDLNETVQDDDTQCCIKIFLTDLTISKARQYPTNDGGRYHVMARTNSYRFNLYILKNDSIGRMTYAEQNDHPIDESKWRTILQPLMMCLDDLDFCDILEVPVRYDSENWQAQLDFMDSQYSGWQVSMSLTEKLEIE